MKKKYIGSGVCLCLFLLLIALLKTFDVETVGPGGTAIGFSHLNMRIHELLGEHRFWYKLTGILGYLAIALGLAMAAAGLIQWMKRKRLTAVDRELRLLGALYVATAAVYLFFEKVIVNYRPVIMEGETAPEASFPSSHTMLSCVILGSLCMLIDRYVKNHETARILRFLAVLMLLLIVIGRLISGVHWFTDILGGVLISLALLLGFAGLLEAKPGEAR